MARVKGKDTKPEWRVRRALHQAGLRYHLHDRSLPGVPDLVFPSKRIVVFVHGCFWHRHKDPTCKLARLPKSRLDFWEPKLANNALRDRRHLATLAERGWTPLVVWECQTRDQARIDALIAQIKDASASPHRRKRETGRL